MGKIAASLWIILVVCLVACGEASETVEETPPPEVIVTLESTTSAPEHPTLTQEPPISTAEPPTSTPDPPPPTSLPLGLNSNLLYKATGVSSQSASITLVNDRGGTFSTDVELPWEKLYPAYLRQDLGFRPGQFAYLSVKNRHDYGLVTCEIWIEETLWKTSTSASIAICQGQVY